MLLFLLLMVIETRTTKFCSLPILLMIMIVEIKIRFVIVVIMVVVGRGGGNHSGDRSFCSSSNWITTTTTIMKKSSNCNKLDIGIKFDDYTTSGRSNKLGEF